MPDPAEVVKAAFVVDQRLRPEQSQDVDLLFQQCGAIGEVDTQPFVLRRVPTDSDGRPDSSAAEQVDRRDLLGNQSDLSLRQHQHAGDELQTRGDRGEVAEEHEDLVERVLGGVRRVREAAERTGAEPFWRRPEDVVVGHEMLESGGLRVDGPLPDRGRDRCRCRPARRRHQFSSVLHSIVLDLSHVRDRSSYAWSSPPIRLAV